MNSNTPLIERFKTYFRVLHESDLSQLRHLYSDQVVFKDPVHEIRGLVELEDYFTDVCGDLTDCRFQYLDAVRAAAATWFRDALVAPAPGELIICKPANKK